MLVTLGARMCQKLGCEASFRSGGLDAASILTSLTIRVSWRQSRRQEVYGGSGITKSSEGGP